MTLVSTIITDAYRELNQIPLGASPSPNQVVEGLARLQAIVNSLVAAPMGELLNDWPLGDFGRQPIDQRNPTVVEISNPPINSNLVHTALAPLTVYFPTVPSNGTFMSFIDPYGRLAAVNVTLDGNGHPINGNPTLVLNTNGASLTWVFRADLGMWSPISNFATTDQFPFPTDYDDFFTIFLAMRLAPRYGRKLDAATLAVYKNGLRDFTNDYLQSTNLRFNSDISRTTLQSFDNGHGYTAEPTTDQFNRGGPW